MEIITVYIVRFYFSVYSLDFVSIAKIYQTLETVFHPISKHLNLLVWKSDETLVFDVLRKNRPV